MTHLKDKKSWLISIVISAGILAFNTAFIPPLYRAMGDQVQASSVFFVSCGLFILRVLWFYINIQWRLMLEKRGP
jgi:hypothetical protein